MRHILKFLSIALSLIALLSAIWIIVPAPAYHIWLFAVAASEWSLWLSVMSLIAVVCGLCVRLFYGDGKGCIVAPIIGCIAFLISIYPFLSVLPLADSQNVALSFSTYFEHLRHANNFSERDEKDFNTVIFARIDGQDLRMDVYPPTASSTSNGAGIVVAHGGSWNAGARNDFPQWNRWLAAQGYTVFDIDYRLAPQPNYLTATGDVKSAVVWIKEHAAEFNISPDRIVIFGRSAGAHLALLAAYSADYTRIPPTNTKPGADARVRAVVSFYAPIDLLWSYDNPANRQVIDGPTTLARFLGGNPHDSVEIRDRFVLASPVSHVNQTTPPTLLVHGGQDQLVRDENMHRLADKLTVFGVAHRTLLIPYAQHGFDYNFNGWGAQISKSVMLDFLRENTKAE